MSFIMCLALILTMGGGLWLSAFSVPAVAAGTTYSNVLDDLKKDSSFNEADYPSVPNDYSLQVIQIAESESGELFLYVYQPGFEEFGLTADYINVAFQDQFDKNTQLKYYKKPLRLLSSEGSLCKYIVDGYEISNEPVRYYSLSSIYRRYVEDVDETFEAIDSIQYHGIPVGKMWTACIYNDVLQYSCHSIEVVPVEITASGEVFYSKNVSIFPSLISSTSIASHYLAFKVYGYDITKVFDMDVTYSLTHWRLDYSGHEKIQINEDLIYKESETLYNSQTVKVESNTWFGTREYTWFRIQTVDEFKEGLSSAGKALSDEELKDVEKAQFVVRIAETEVKIGENFFRPENWWELEEGGVLRLHFETPEGVYNLGAVSDLVGTDGKSDAKSDYSSILDEIKEMLSSALGLASLFLIVYVIKSYVLPLFELLFEGVRVIFDVILIIITFPFRFLFSQKRRKRK